MVASVPYHPGQPQPEEALESPEILVINALLDTGEFKPAQYALDKEMLTSHDKVWQFCCDYQMSTGSCPPRQLVARSFPGFEQLEGVDIRWAADQLRAKHHENTVRRTLQKALASMHDGDMEGARELIAEAAKPTLLSRPDAMSVYDSSTVEGSHLKKGWKEPWETLQKATEGIGRGEVRMVAAAWGVGKTWIAPLYAVTLAAQGANVCILTMEVPKRVYARRTQQIITAGDVSLQRALKSVEEKTRLAALHSLPPLKGAIDVLDPSDVRMTTKAIEMAGLEYDAVIVDHVGLMRDSHGKPFIEDWRVAAGISNRIKEITLELDIAVICAAQLNREGAATRGKAAGGDKLGGTVALAQDADVLHMLKRMTDNGRSMLHDFPKVRGGFATKLWTMFDPTTADFSEITKDKALDIQQEDEAAKNE